MRRPPQLVVRTMASGRSAAVTVTELRRYSGTQFDRLSVDALCAALPQHPLTKEPQLVELFGGGV